MKIDFEKTIEILKNMDNVAILIHQFPDGDTIGCGYSLCHALQRMGKKAFVECSHTVDKKFKYITDIVKVQEFTPQSVVSVDVASLELLGEPVHSKYEDKINLCIDHHASNDDFADFSLVDGSSAAACEIVYDVICALCEDVTLEEAAALYTGIATDTGCFKFTNTTARTHIITAKLIEKGIDYGEINRIMFDTKSKSRIAIETKAMESIEYACDGKIALMSITKKMREETGASDSELDGITGLPRQIEGVILGITVRERDDINICKISARTHAPISASDYCANFGGGGHERAGGCSINKPIDIAKQMLLEQAKLTLKQLGIC